jgi:hypothetical protein
MVQGMSQNEKAPYHGVCWENVPTASDPGPRAEPEVPACPAGPSCSGAAFPGHPEHFEAEFTFPTPICPDAKAGKPHAAHRIEGTWRERCPGIDETVQRRDECERLVTRADADTLLARATAQRIRVIAALHGAAQWLTDNPDIPTPNDISIWSNPPAAGDVAAVDAFAELHGAERYTLQNHEYAKVRIGTQRDADVTYTLAITRKDS